MEASFFTRHPFLKDAIGIVLFIVCVIIGTVLINAFIFRSYHVQGPSMEPTMYTGDRLIVDRLPVTWAHLLGKEYLPSRGSIIVFENPHFSSGQEDQYLVKRVIGLPGERVTLVDGVFTIYNDANPTGFDPDSLNKGEPGSPSSGAVDIVVPDGEIFVSGDHRQGSFSLDSRNGLGTVPLYDIVGPVSWRIFPINKIRSF